MPEIRILKVSDKWDGEMNMKWYKQSTEEVLNKLEAKPTGLNKQERKAV